MVDYAKENNIDYIATGHYARIDKLSNGRYAICNSVTATKDQTYALCNLTQEQLAESVDKSPVMISRYINGDSIPSVIVARKIAKALGCSLDDFFYKQF